MKKLQMKSKNEVKTGKTEKDNDDSNDSISSEENDGKKYELWTDLYNYPWFIAGYEVQDGKLKEKEITEDQWQSLNAMYISTPGTDSKAKRKTTHKQIPTPTPTATTTPAALAIPPPTADTPYILESETDNDMTEKNACLYCTKHRAVFKCENCVEGWNMFCNQCDVLHDRKYGMSDYEHVVIGVMFFFVFFFIFFLFGYYGVFLGNFGFVVFCNKTNKK